jgi:hypothetical protein
VEESQGMGGRSRCVLAEQTHRDQSANDAVRCPAPVAAQPWLAEPTSGNSLLAGMNSLLARTNSLIGVEQVLRAMR